MFSTKKQESVEEKEIPLYEIVIKAGKGFISGYENNNRIIKKALKDETLKAKFDTEKRFVSIKDESFKMDANRIPGTNFVACAGPRTREQLSLFLDDTVCHSGTPIYQIVALCNRSSYLVEPQDFYDYCLTERDIQCESHHVHVKRLKGDILLTNDGKSVKAKSFLLSELTVKKNDENIENKRKLNVTLFYVVDNTAIMLHSPFKSQKKLINSEKEELWRLFQKSQQELILVHCASGVGRTGHFILMMLILKHYDEIFSNNSAAGAKKIHEILNRMRSVRVTLVATREQFTQAIYNAVEIHEYALKMKYIESNKNNEPKTHSKLDFHAFWRNFSDSVSSRPAPSTGSSVLNNLRK